MCWTVNFVFLELFKRWTEKALCPKSFSSKEKQERAKVCVLFMIRSFGSVLCEMKMLTREQLDERITFTSYLNVAANVLNESTFFHSEHKQSFKRNCKRFVSSASLHRREIHTVTIDAAKGMQEAVVHVDCGGGGNNRIFFDGCSKVFNGDVSQPHSAAKSSITCPVEQFRTYMNEKANV